MAVEDEAVSAEREIVQETGHHHADRHEGHERERVGQRRDHRAQTPDGKITTIAADILLVATGRRAVTTGLGAPRKGIAMEKGYIKVDGLYRTSVAGISAIGDVITVGTGVHPQLAHVSSGGRHCGGADRWQDRAAAQLRPRARLYVLRSRDWQRRPHRSPGEVRGYDVRVGTFPFGVLGRARMAGAGRVREDRRRSSSDEVLGVHMIGPRSTELVAEAVLASLRVHRGGTDQDHSCAPDLLRGGR